MISSVFGAFEDWLGTRGACCIGGTVREGYQLGEGVGSMGAFEERCVTDLLLADA
jgi:hypothetical protein